MQIYEDILGDANGHVTTGILSAVRYLKDNRLLPAGFDKLSAAPEIAVLGEATADAGFRGGPAPDPLFCRPLRIGRTLSSRSRAVGISRSDIVGRTTSSPIARRRSPRVSPDTTIPRARNSPGGPHERKLDRNLLWRLISHRRGQRHRTQYRTSTEIWKICVTGAAFGNDEPGLGGDPTRSYAAPTHTFGAAWSPARGLTRLAVAR